jgi:hypothetical protein
MVNLIKMERNLNEKIGDAAICDYISEVANYKF